MRSILALFSVLLIPIAAQIVARADDPESPANAVGASSDLVRKLGDPSFRVREFAERELLRRGATALAEVKRGAQDADLEIRRRSQNILNEIQRSEADVFLEAFLAGKEVASAPLPGWSAVRKIMGDDATSRYLYAILYKSDRPMLDLLERNPKALGEQFDGRMKKLQSTFNLGAKAKRAQEISIEEIAAVLLIVTAEQAKLDANSSNRLISLLGLQPVQRCIQWSHATRRLTEKFLEQKCDDPALSSQVYYLAMVYGCAELIEARLRPVTAKAVDAAAANPADFNLFYRALNQARQCNMTDLIDLKLKPAIRNSLEAARDPVDFNRLNQLANCAQQIGGMEDELKPVLRPVLTQLVKKQIEQMSDFSRFYAIINLARLSQNDDILDDILRPAFRVSLLQLTAQAKDAGTLTNAFYQAQTLGMQDEIESILKPAAEAMIQTLVAKRDDVARLQQALNLAQTLQLKETLRPVVEKLIDDAAGTTPNLDRIFIVIQFARVAALPDVDQVIDRQLKPPARKALLAAADQPINLTTISQTLSVAEQLQLKEVAPLALKALQAKNLPPYVQSQAIFQVARHGAKDAIPHIEALLGDKTNLGAAGINGLSINAQIGDVALAALIHLSGQKLEDYDFPWGRVVGQGANQTLQSSPHCYGFENDAARQAAQKKWRDSQTGARK